MVSGSGEHNDDDMIQHSDVDYPYRRILGCKEPKEKHRQQRIYDTWARGKFQVGA
jgi:hypothetical protein